VYYYAINKSTNQKTSGFIAYNAGTMIAANTGLAPQIWRHNANSGLAVGLDIMQYSLRKTYHF
jgi:hypothetical protein